MRISYDFKNKETGEIFHPQNRLYAINSDGLPVMRDCGADCEGEWIWRDVSMQYEVVNVRINEESDDVGVNFD